jgi:cellulose synthase/poly-beta-1,6-N-acetylglucosamine synthase-like glycosyltransferase
MYTGMKLHAAGYKSLYHNEILAIGSAPVDLKETLEQRKRWAQGAVEVSFTFSSRMHASLFIILINADFFANPMGGISP